MMAKATFGAGCFWGVEEVFRQTDGVTDTAVGYMGGMKAHPTYEEVCRDNTGHVEVVEVSFDTDRVPYTALLDIFFGSHNPTQVNRQGPDIGAQYRSVIFYHDDDQRQSAEAVKSALAGSGRFSQPIATSIEPAQSFWRAEDYHQQYLAKRGLGSCHV